MIKKNSSKTDFSDTVITIVEGNLIEQNDKGVTLEIMNGLIVTLKGKAIRVAKSLEDPETGRPFVRIELYKGDFLNFELEASLLTDALKSKALPMAFAEMKGLAFESGEIGLTSESSSSEAFITTEEGEEIFLPFWGDPKEGTRCIMMTCRRWTPVWTGIVCDREVADINTLDDKNE